jgi:CTP:phosphocholine cytidylyltransferase-like protein
LIDTQEIIKMASFFSIIAHTPGRLRVRVNPKIKDSSGNITIADIENLPNKIDGIISIKVNKIIASVTIMYEPNIFKPKLWENLVKNENIEELSILINKLAKEVI